MSKKDLAKASAEAVNKFFSSQSEEVLLIPASHQDAQYTDNTNQSNINNDTKHTHVTNKSKHYNDRGKREVRYGLLLDKQLKEDLTQLCNATGNRSMNDYIVSILIKHTEQPENKKLIIEYNKLNAFK